MEKINTLTKEQLDKIPEYVEKWIKLGLTTERCNEDDAKIDFFNFQKIVLKKEAPAPVVLVNSPFEANKLIAKEFKIEGDVNLNIYPYFDCQFWAGWFAFYEFFRVELGIEYSNIAEYNAFKACQKYGMVYPLDTLCIVCQPPTVIKKNDRGLHCEDGPALSYSGDNEIYALNGVVMTKEYVMTPAEKISGQTIFRESNVEVRRELLRKVGIEQVFEQLPHKLLDKRDNYELYSIDLSDTVKDARYLKMTNPSIGCFHMEGVDPEINTVSEALLWRNNNMFENADVLT